MILRYLKLIIVLSLVLLVAGTGVYLYANSYKLSRPLVYNQKNVLSALWYDYKKVYIDEESGRTVDRQNNNITTSEGQSYSMLRAVWQSDQESFDKSFEWSKQNLQHKDDALFAWKYGPRPDNTYAVLTEVGGNNAALDADLDIALALIMATKRWENPQYLAEAKLIISSIWEKAVEQIGTSHYLYANDIEKQNKELAIVNPSYCAIYTLRLFAKIDPVNNWNSVIDSCYEIINFTTIDPLDTERSAGLVPDWIILNKKTGVLAASQNKQLSTNFGYDAFRTVFRLGLDYNWNKDIRSLEALKKFEYLSEVYQKFGYVPPIITHGGKVLESKENTAAYASTLAYFSTVEPLTAQEIYEQKILKLFNVTNNQWNTPATYYDDNWAWFGIALYQNELPNLANQLF